MGRGIEDSLAIREKVSAGGLPFTSTDQANITPIQIHNKDLIALKPISGCLKDQLFPIEREVGLRILTSEGQLPDVGKVPFLRKNLTLNIETKEQQRTCNYENDQYNSNDSHPHFSF